MATLPTSGAVTLLDYKKALDPNDQVAVAIELLAQTNEMLLDMTWLEGNLVTGHQTTVRTGLPSSTWRKLYQGVQPSKSTRAKITDTCGMLETRSEVDKDAFLGGDIAGFRLSESMAFMESMNQDLQSAIMYEDETTNSERITGLSPRYSSLSAGSGDNILDAGGSGSDNTSIWLICWGENTVTGIYPKGSKAGIQHEDLGLIDAFDSNNNRFRAYADHWQWKCGINVRDWRYAVRIANVDISDLEGQTGTQASTASTAIIKLMVQSMARIPNMGMGKCAFYCNRKVKEMLTVAALDKSNGVLAIQPAVEQFGEIRPGFAGNGTLTCLGTPIRTVDSILQTESAVS